MAQVAAHLSIAELEERFRSARDPILARHAQVIWLLAQGHTTAQVRHDCSPLRFSEAAPIAALMGSTRPGAIGPHPKGRSAAQSGEGRLFCRARNAGGAAAGRGKELARTVAAPDEAKPDLGPDPPIKAS